MIPFWKKTGKHSKPQSAQKRRQKAKPAVPRTAQQSIPMQRMFEDGTCRVKPNYYTRTIQYQDINYQLAQQEDKTAIFEEWCSFLNFFDAHRAGSGVGACYGKPQQRKVHPILYGRDAPASEGGADCR